MTRGRALRAFARLAPVLGAIGMVSLLVPLMGSIGTAMLSGTHANRSLVLVVFALASGYVLVLAALSILVAAAIALLKPSLGDHPRLGRAARVSALYLVITLTVLAYSPQLAERAQTQMRFVTAITAAVTAGGLLSLALGYLPPRGWHTAFERIRFAGALTLALALGAYALWPRPVPQPARVQTPAAPLTTSPSDVVVLGLDGADWIVLGGLMEAGLLPNLARVRAEGVSAELFIRFPFTPPSWATLFSGVEHEAHGIVDFSGHVNRWGDLVRLRRVDDVMSRIFSQPFIDEGESPIARAALAPVRFARARYHASVYPVSGALSLLDATHIRHKRLWQIAEDAALRTGTFGVDMSWPAEPVSGYLVSDRFVRGERTAAVYPAHLTDSLAVMLAEELSLPPELAAMLGAASRPGRRDDLSQPERNGAFLLEVTVEQWRDWMDEIRIARHVWARSGGLDLVTLKFRQPDTLKHFLLPFLRPDRFPWLELSDDARSAIEALILDAYRRMDDLVGEILASGRALCVVSDHGFYPNPGGSARTDGLSLNVDALLKELGWLVRDETGAVDLRSSRAYDPGMPTPAGTSIVRVTEPASRPALIDALENVRDADDGGSTFTTVQTFGDSDIRLRYGKAMRLRDALVPLTRRVDLGERIVPMTSVFTLHPTFGGHRQGTKVPGYGQAVFLLHGPPVERGIRLEDVEDVDIAPTVLYLLGIPISEELPGRVIEEALRPEFLSANPPTRVPSYGPHEFDPDLLDLAREAHGSEATEKEMVDRIRALGYLN